MSAQPDGTAPQPPSGSGQSLQATVTRANEEVRKRSPFMFLVIGLCFFLPFISLSCSGQRLGTMSGLQLVTGAEMEIDEEALNEDLASEFGLPPPTEDAEDTTPAPENDPSIWAIVALAGAVIGVVVGFVTRGRTRALASLIAALLGLTGLIALRFDLQGDLSEAEGLVAIEYRIGYWISALLFALLALAHGLWLRAARSTGPPSTGPPDPAP